MGLFPTMFKKLRTLSKTRESNHSRISFQNLGEISGTLLESEIDLDPRNHNPIYVNFISATKVGFGSVHRKLMSTEYSVYVDNMEIPQNLPFVDLKGQVLTVVFKPSHKYSARLEDVKMAFKEIRKYCAAHSIPSLYISFQPWLREGVSPELIRMISSKTFNDSKILVFMG